MSTHSYTSKRKTNFLCLLDRVCLRVCFWYFCIIEGGVLGVELFFSNVIASFLCDVTRVTV